MNSLQVFSLTKKFGSFTALRDIGFNLKEGEILILLGPNGAGKSTLLKSIAGLYNLNSGYVKIFGRDIKRHAIEVKRMLSFLGENYALYDDLTVKENIIFFGRLYDIPEQELKKRMERLLKEFNAIEYIDKKIGELSRGTRQKIAICRALMNEPKILLLDEPSAFLDPATSNRLHTRLNELAKSGVSIVYATQKLDELYRIGDKMLLLNNGRMVAFGSAGEVIGRLKNVDVEVLTSNAINQKTFSLISRKWRVRYGNTNNSLIFRLGSISEIPRMVKGIVNNGCNVVSVSYISQNINKIISG